MKTYISLIRGLNVSGKNRIAMEVLCQVYHNLGLRTPTSYIQSGNVVFQSTEENPEILAEQIKLCAIRAYRYTDTSMGVYP